MNNKIHKLISLRSLYALAFVFLLSSLVPVLAQEQEKKWAIGIHAGGNLSDKKDDKPWKSQLGYKAGLYVDYHIPHMDYLFMRTGANYSLKGSSRNFEWDSEINSSEPTTGKFDYTLTYLEIPLLIGIHIPVNDDFIFNILFGGYYSKGLDIEAIQYTNTGNQRLAKNMKTWHDANLKDNDYGVVLTFEAVYKGFTGAFNIENGMLDISKHRKDITANFDKWHNMNYSLTVGYKFHIK